MEKYKISYFYLATGMEGQADTYPEHIIEAEDKDKAIYNYWNLFTNHYESFEDFISQEKYIREWGISCTKL